MRITATSLPLAILLLPLVSLAAEPMPLKEPVLFNTPEADAILQSLQVFPPDNAWNADISQWPVHENSAAIVASIGNDKPLRYNTDMGFVLVPPNHNEGRCGTVSNIPTNPTKGRFRCRTNIAIEGWPAKLHAATGGAKTLPRSTTCSAIRPAKEATATPSSSIRQAACSTSSISSRRPTRAGRRACAAIFDLQSQQAAARRLDQHRRGRPADLSRHHSLRRTESRRMVKHAMRVTVRNTRRAYVAPATHFASRKTDENLPRMGERLRLKADYDIGGFSPEVQAILKALKKHGMLVADNGIEWAVCCAPDERIPVAARRTAQGEGLGVRGRRVAAGSLTGYSVEGKQCLDCPVHDRRAHGRGVGLQVGLPTDHNAMKSESLRCMPQGLNEWAGTIFNSGF